LRRRKRKKKKKDNPKVFGFANYIANLERERDKYRPINKE